MPTTIQQTVRFPASPAELYATYIDPKKHAAAVNAKVSIARKVGGSFSAFGGALRGRMLAIVPGRMIVQTWRSGNWKRGHPDSVLVLTFEKVPGGARVNLVHANVPAERYRRLERGWTSYYWKPWRKYLKRRRRVTRSSAR